MGQEVGKIAFLRVGVQPPLLFHTIKNATRCAFAQKETLNFTLEVF